MKQKTKKFFRNPKFFIVFVFVFVLMPAFIWADNNDKALEIVYPTIPGATTPKTVASGLPEYVDYILKFAMIIIGLVVLGALIYSGILWLTSTGKPEQLSSARQGIFSAFLGAIILFSAYLIFNTINPELTILTPPEIGVLEPTVTPGIYLCNYPVDDINSVIERYKSEDKDTKIKGAEELKTIMKNDKGTCYKVNTSEPSLKNFVFKPRYHTAFVIPQKEYVYDKNSGEVKEEWFYDYGIILHQKDNFRGECILAGLYEPLELSDIDEVRSVTLFQKPEEDPGPDNWGVILYQCLAYNEGGTDSCPSGVTGTPISQSFKPANYVLFVPKGTKDEKTEGGEFGGGEGGEFGGGGAQGKWEGGEKTGGTELDSLAENTRSIKIDPVDSYFAILFSEDNFTGKTCEVISRNDNNLLDNPIGRCGTTCNGVLGKIAGLVSSELKRCIPCLKSMIVVKGKVIY